MQPLSNNNQSEICKLGDKCFLKMWSIIPQLTQLHNQNLIQRHLRK